MTTNSKTEKGKEILNRLIPINKISIVIRNLPRKKMSVQFCFIQLENSVKHLRKIQHQY